MTIQEERICAYLRQAVEQTEWQVYHPQQGFMFGKRFTCVSARRKVFVKLDVDYRVVQHLSEIQLTPRYLAGGVFADTTITVQEFVEGSHPDSRWYMANQRVVARLLKTLQEQTALYRYLPAVESETYRDLLARYVQQARELYQQQSALEQARRQEIDALFDLYEKRLPFIQGEGLVPTHGDPNPGNVLVAPETTYLVDWDRLHLSDPMHDIAQVLWWTYPRPAWSEALELFQIDLSDDQQRERFYLYLSVWALEVSLFFSGIQNEYFARRFLTDARRAYEQEPPVEHLVS